MKFYRSHLIAGEHKLHEHEIVRQELKPENIITKMQNLKISDFGLSKSCNL